MVSNVSEKLLDTVWFQVFLLNFVDLLTVVSDRSTRACNWSATTQVVPLSIPEFLTGFCMLVSITKSSFNLDCGSYINAIAKTTSKEIGSLIHSLKFLSFEVAVYIL